MVTSPHTTAIQSAACPLPFLNPDHRRVCVCVRVSVCAIKSCHCMFFISVSSSVHTYSIKILGDQIQTFICPGGFSVLCISLLHQCLHSGLPWSAPALLFILMVLLSSFLSRWTVEFISHQLCCWKETKSTW
ncbi:unnamed protein product [Arctogadus glacialis]